MPRIGFRYLTRLLLCVDVVSLEAQKHNINIDDVETRRGEARYHRSAWHGKALQGIARLSDNFRVPGTLLVDEQSAEKRQLHRFTDLQGKFTTRPQEKGFKAVPAAL